MRKQWLGNSGRNWVSGLKLVSKEHPLSRLISSAHKLNRVCLLAEGIRLPYILLGTSAQGQNRFGKFGYFARKQKQSISCKMDKEDPDKVRGTQTLGPTVWSDRNLPKYPLALKFDKPHPLGLLPFLLPCNLLKGFFPSTGAENAYCSWDSLRKVYWSYVLAGKREVVKVQSSFVFHGSFFPDTCVQDCQRVSREQNQNSKSACQNCIREYEATATVSKEQIIFGIAWTGTRLNPSLLRDLQDLSQYLPVDSTAIPAQFVFAFQNFLPIVCMLYCAVPLHCGDGTCCLNCTGYVLIFSPSLSCNFEILVRCWSKFVFKHGLPQNTWHNSANHSRAMHLDLLWPPIC